MKGLDLHRGFFNDCGRPMLMEAFPEEFTQIAAASVGVGSDRLGADDERSQDHCWEPGFMILSDRLPREVLKEIESYLFEHLPWEYEGFKRSDCPGLPYGIQALTTDEFFSSYTSFATPPTEDRHWLLIADEALYHVTNGEVFYDPTGDLTSRREAFGYFPDNVWRYKLAGRAFRVNAMMLEMVRCLSHGEDFAADLMLHEGLRETLHFLCLVNKRYSCHDKWLPWMVRRMPVLADKVYPLFDQIRETTDTHSRLSHFKDIITVLADYVYGNGLATKGEYWWADLPNRNPWWLDLREAITGDLRDSRFPAWIGVEFRYASQFAFDGDFRTVIR